MHIYTCAHVQVRPPTLLSTKLSFSRAIWISAPSKRGNSHCKLCYAKYVPLLRPQLKRDTIPSTPMRELRCRLAWPATDSLLDADNAYVRTYVDSGRRLALALAADRLACPLGPSRYLSRRCRPRGRPYRRVPRRSCSSRPNEGRRACTRAGTPCPAGKAEGEIGCDGVIG